MRSALARLFSLRSLTFLANFGLGKGIAFLGPIWLGLTLPPQTYALLEYALAIAGFCVLFTTFGVPQATMQLVVMRQGRQVSDLLASVASVAGGTVAALALVLAISGASAQWTMALAVLGLSVCQQCASAYARAHGLRNLTAWADHLHLVMIVVATAGLSLVARPVAVDSLKYTLFALAIAGTGAALGVLWWTLRPSLGVRLREAARLGWPMLLSSLCYGWVIASGRILIERFLGKDDLYTYAFTFRVAGLLLLIHAVIVTAFAAKLYKMPTRRFDRVASWMVLVLGAGSILFILFEPEKLISVLAAQTGFGVPGNIQMLSERPERALVALQVFFWGAGALLEMRLARARRAGAMVPRTLAILALTIAAVLGASVCGQLGFGSMLVILVVQQGLMCFALHEVLLRRRVPVRKTALTTAGAAIAIAALAAWATGIR